MIVELVAPPEVLEALTHGRRFGPWIRAACPYCSEGRPGDRPLAANLSGGFGKRRDRPGWLCHRCHAEEHVRHERRAQARATFFHDQRAQVQDDERRREAALRILEQARPIEPGDPVDTYLRGRGLRPLAPTWPSTLLRAYLTHPDDRRERRARRWPVMLAVVTDAQRQPQAVHRTFLTEAGTKAPYGTVKMSLGPLKGHAVQLGADSESIVIAEGIETTLAAMRIFHRVGWAGISASGVQGIVVPSGVRDIVVIADRDEADRWGRRAGQHAARRCATRLRAEGREVRVLVPEAPAKDAADVWAARMVRDAP